MLDALYISDPTGLNDFIGSVDNVLRLHNKRAGWPEKACPGRVDTIFVGDVEFHYNGSDSQMGSLRGIRKRVGSQVLITRDTVSAVERTHYRHVDHQGSLVALSDENGETIARMSFDPWGARRALVAGDNDGWIPYTRPIAAAWNEEFQRMLDWTERGYTGHEHMDALGLIHMNGRIYDPVLARFIQSDPFIEDTGTLNRYTYVHNNPLGWVDPSGFTGRPNNTRDRGNQAFRMFASGVIGMATWAYAATSITTGMTVAEKASVAAVAASGSAASTYVATGSVKGAFISFSTALLFNSVGQGFHDKSLPKQMFAHGIVGGVSAAASGGDFARGFVAASFTKMVSPSIQDLPVGTLEQTLIAGAVSGLASEISGGEFGLAAVRGAMGYALNQNLSNRERQERRRLWNRIRPRIATVMMSNPAASPAEKKEGLLERVGIELSNRRDQDTFEWCGPICSDGANGYAVPIGTSGSVIGCIAMESSCPAGYQYIGESIHVHGLDEKTAANSADEAFIKLRGGLFYSGMDVYGQDPDNFSPDVDLVNGRFDWLYTSDGRLINDGGQ